MGDSCGSFFSVCLSSACGVSHFSGCQDKTEPPVSGLEEGYAWFYHEGDEAEASWPLIYWGSFHSPQGEPLLPGCMIIHLG